MRYFFLEGVKMAKMIARLFLIGWVFLGETCWTCGLIGSSLAGGHMDLVMTRGFKLILFGIVFLCVGAWGYVIYLILCKV